MAKTGHATCPACKKGQLREIGKDKRNLPIYECGHCGEKLVELEHTAGIAPLPGQLAPDHQTESLTDPRGSHLGGARRLSPTLPRG